MRSDKHTLSDHYWAEVLTVDNVIEYGKAAMDLCCCLRVLFQEGFDSIVIPSRGAMPIFRAAKHAWYSESSFLESGEERLESRLEILGSAIHAVTILPFSADPTDTQTSKGIRRFWAKVLSALIRRDGKDPCLAFYQKIVQHLQGKDLNAVLPRDLPNDKFVFIDTVVSGRAVDEILEAFEIEGLNNFHLILLVDNSEGGIKGVYKRRIDALVAEGRCTIFNLKNLWTEDRGPSVSGVWSTVYPQILSKLQGRYSWSRDCYGAGSFYHKVSSSQVEVQDGIGSPDYNMPVTRLLSAISVMIHQVVAALQRLDFMSKRYVMAPAIREREWERIRLDVEFHLKLLREDLLEFVEFSPLEKTTTLMLAEPRVHQMFEAASVSVSSSHLVRVELPAGDVDDLFVDFDRAMQDLDYNSLGEGGFREVNDWGNAVELYRKARDAARECSSNESGQLSDDGRG